MKASHQNLVLMLPGFVFAFGFIDVSSIQDLLLFLKKGFSPLLDTPFNVLSSNYGNIVIVFISYINEQCCFVGCDTEYPGRNLLMF
jgi:hypothetical protein